MSNPQSSTNNVYQDIVPLGDSFECLDKIILASDLEKSGKIQEAITQWQASPDRSLS